MKTNLLQSQLCRNAATITALCLSLSITKDAMRDAKGVPALEAAIAGYLKQLRRERAQIVKLAAIQKAIKFDLCAEKLARLRQVGHKRRKHNKNDVRFTNWLASQPPTHTEGIGGAAPAVLMASLAVAPAQSCAC